MPVVPHMEPKRRPLSWEAFLAETPSGSIAVDGFVDGPPAVHQVTRHVNFDHHTGVSRIATACSGMQVLTAIRAGLFDWITQRDSDDAHVWMNDCDPDVALCWFALSNPALVMSVANPAVNRLYGHAQMMDVFSGLWEVPRTLDIVVQAAWVFKPYWDYRMSGALDQKDASRHMSVLSDCARRIGDFVAGRGGRTELDMRFERLAGDDRWPIVREFGPHARLMLAEQGVRAFVSVRTAPGGGWYYTLSRQSPFVYWFPVDQIGNHINDILNERGEASRFGGGDLVQGNSRGPGCNISPADLGEILQDLLTASADRR